ncbi:MAG: TolC family protein [Planctomycetes bacterium]|nr:TolC family protein [Planctomycetota bacterium]
MSRHVAFVPAGMLTLLLTGCGLPRHDHAVFDRFRDDARGAFESKLTAALPAVEQLPAQPTLDDYVAYAALHNHRLEAAFNRWKAAVEQVPQARSLPDPRLSYRYYISEVETRVGAMRQGVGVWQTFPWWAKLVLRARQASDAARAAEDAFRQQRWQLRQRVADAYWELYYLDRSIEVVAENRRLVEHLEGVARTEYKAATASHPDVIRAQVELGKLDDRLKSLQDLRGPAAARLNAALNRPASAEVPAPAPIKQPAVALDDELLMAEMLQSNPERAAMLRENCRTYDQIKLAKLAYVPDLTLGADYTDINDSTAGRHPGDDGKDAVAVTASVNVPIWIERIEAGIREARHRHRAAVLASRQKETDLAAELKQAIYNYRDAERKFHLYSRTLQPQAEQLVKTQESAFRGGTSSFLDLVDAQRVLLEFALAADRARADRAKALVRIEAMLAGPVTAVGKQR